MLEIKEYIPDNDTRSILLNCHMCGRFIHGATKGFPGDIHYVLPTDEIVCEYCVKSWVKKYRVWDYGENALQDS